MKTSTIEDAQRWDQVLRRLPNPHVLQRYPWGAFKSRWGWQPTRLLWTGPDGRPLAAAQILRRRIPRTPWSMLYVSKGPLLDYTDPPLVSHVLGSLEAIARQQGALFIKIDPDVPLAFEPDDPTPDPHGAAVRSLLQQRGWRYSSEQIQFKNTVLIDLTPDEDDLLAGFKSKWRYNIRLAGRKGVVVRRGGPADLPTFFDLYATTSRRDGFLIRPEAYYLDVWETFLGLADQPADLLLAQADDAVVAGLILFYCGQTAWYLYGASSNEHRNRMPNHLLQWEAIKLARKRGCTRYDLWGAPDTFVESDPMWGVYKFKLGFNGRTRQGLGAFDYPVQPRLYTLFNRLLPRLRAVLKRIGPSS